MRSRPLSCAVLALCLAGSHVACDGGGGAEPFYIPVGVTAVAGDGEVTVSWSPVDGADSYNIYWQTAPGVVAGVATCITGATSPYLHGSLTNGTTYYYRVSALVAGVEYQLSMEVSGTPQPPPAAAATVTAVGGAQQVVVTWSDVALADTYTLYWSTTTGVTSATGTAIDEVTSPYTHSSLADDQDYYYVVVASNGAGIGPDSSEASATTYPPVPAAPTGLTATPDDETVSLSWDATPYADTYEVYWGTSAGVTPLTGTLIAVATTSYEHTGRTNGTTYYYVVRAENVAGEGPTSTEVLAVPAIQPPGAPSGVAAAGGPCSITVSWDAVAEADDYAVYWSTTAGVTAATGTEVILASSPFVHSPLDPSLTHHYVVAARNVAGPGSESAEVSAAAQAPLPPTGLTALATDGAVIVSWVAPPCATAFNVYRATSPGVTTGGGAYATDVDQPFVDTGVSNGTTYYYIVTCLRAGVEGGASVAVSATPVATSAAPAAPRHTGVTAGDARLVVSWPEVAGATSYNVYVASETGVTPATVGSLADGQSFVGVTSPYVIDGVTNGTVYYAVATAVNVHGESDASPEFAVVPRGVKREMVLTTDGFLPTTVAVGAGGTVTWRNATATPQMLQGGGVTGTMLPASDTVDHVYAAASTNHVALQSDSFKATDVVVVEVPLPPRRVQALSREDGVRITWEPVPGALRYNLYMAQEPGPEPGGVGSLRGGATISNVNSPVTLAGLVNGCYYYFTVSAETEAGESAASHEVRARPLWARAPLLSVAHVVETFTADDVVVSDVNLDGRPDIVIGTGGHDCAVSICLQDPDRPGAFLAATTNPLRTAVYTSTCVDVGDLNDDGWPDIVSLISGSGLALSVLFQDPVSPGHFLPAIDLDSDAQSVIIADVNWDGFLDIVSANSIGLTGVLVNFQDAGNPGTFLPQEQVGPTYDGYGLAAGDLDGNGLPDITVGGRRVMVQLATDPGTFDPTSSRSDMDTMNNSTQIVDLNLDGIPEITHSPISGPLRSYSMEADRPGYFSFASAAPVYSGSHVILGDLDNDAQVDIASAKNEEELYVRMSVTGSPGAYGAEVQCRTGARPTGIVIEDINGDWAGDVVLSCDYTMPLTVIHYQSTTTRGALLASEQIAPLGYQVASADLDADGYDDLVIANAPSNTQVSVLLQDSASPGTYLTATVLDSASGGMAIGDVNDDGHLDLAIAPGLNLNVFLQEATGGGVFEPVTQCSGYGANSLCVIDLDEDGYKDYLTVRGDTLYNTFTARGNYQDSASPGTFLDMVYMSSAYIGMAARVADVDADGYDDVAVVRRGATVAFREAGGVVSSIALLDEGEADGGPMDVAVGDLNADGVTDVAAVWRDDRVSVYLQDAASPRSFAPGVYYRVFDYAHQDGPIAIGDVDGDGFNDIVCGGADAGAILVQDSASPGTFLNVIGYLHGAEFLTFTDNNADGVRDLVVSWNDVSTNDVVLKMLGVPRGLPAPLTVEAEGGDTQVTITWSDVPGAASYNIFWSDALPITPHTGTAIVGATSPYVHSGPANGQRHYYVVTAVDADGQSPQSVFASAVPHDPAGAPAAPSSITVTPGDAKARVSWRQVVGATSYNVYVAAETGVGPATYAGLAEGAVHTDVTAPYILTGLTNDTTYYFVATAVNGGAEGGASVEATAEPRVCTTQYSVTELTDVNGATLDMNAAGVLVGYIGIDTNGQGYSWDAGTVTWLDGVATGITTSGVICGWVPDSPTYERAVVWESGVRRFLDEVAVMGDTRALCISDDGYVAGYGDDEVCIWRPDGTTLTNQYFGDGWIEAINASGEAAVTGNGLHRWRFQSGLIEPLGSNGNSTEGAHAINEKGQIVGTIRIASDDTRACVWEEGYCIDLGASPVAGRGAAADDVNARGQVIGHYGLATYYPFGASGALLFEDGQVKQLNDLIPAGSGWDIRSASIIMDDGVILGRGLYNSTWATYILTPLD